MSNEKYRPVKTLGLTAILGFAAILITSAISIYFYFNYASFWERVEAPGELDETQYLALIEQAENFDSFELTFSIVTLSFYVVAGIVFLMWFYRAYSNLSLFNYRREHKKGWAIGGFFVPILNIWRPYGIAREIWRRSLIVLHSYLWSGGVHCYAQGSWHGYRLKWLSRKP